MSNKAEKGGLVPKLRFPEFREAGEWEENLLAKVCNVLQGYGFPDALQGKSDGKYPFCKVSDISRAVAESGGVLAAAANYVGTEELLKLRAKPVPKGATVFAKIGEALRLNRRAYVQKECLIDNNATGLKAIDGVADDYFVYLLSQLIDLNKHCGGAVPSVNKSTLEGIQVAVPGPDEQKRIADCLASLDELITLEAQKLDTLKTHKKGLMQQLFPAEGETLPKLRFPEFRDAGEWEVCDISTFAKVTTGGKDTQNKVDSGIYPFFVRSQTVERINSYSYDGEAVLTSGDGVGVGKNYHYIKGKFDFHQRVYCIYDFSECVSGLFFYLYFSEHFNKRVMKMSAKNSVDSVRMPMVTEMPVLLPSLLEQQKIADCLASLDDLITAQTQKLAALKTHKKGLMQQLFPALDEATS